MQPLPLLTLSFHDISIRTPPGMLPSHFSSGKSIIASVVSIGPAIEAAFRRAMRVPGGRNVHLLFFSLFDNWSFGGKSLLNAGPRCHSGDNRGNGGNDTKPEYIELKSISTFQVLQF